MEGGTGARRPAMGFVPRLLFILGCCAFVIWIGIAAWWFWRVVADGCLTAGSIESPPGEDCGDTRRGAFAIALAAFIVIALPGLFLMVPALIHRLKWWGHK